METDELENPGPERTSVDSTGRSVTKADVLEVINNELMASAQARLRHGWTQYAVMVTMASLIWLFLIIWESNQQISIQLTSRLILTGVYLVAAFHLIISLLQLGSERSRYFWPATYLSDRRLPISIFLMRLCFLIALGTYIFINSWLSLFIVVFPIVVLSAVAALVLIITFTDLLIVRSAPHNLSLSDRGLTVFTVSVLAIAIPIAVLANDLSFAMPGMDLAETKLAAIVLGIFYLSPYLPRAQPNVSSTMLRELQQSVLLGDLSPASAANQVELVVKGREASRYFSTKVDELLEENRKARELLGMMETEFQVLTEVHTEGGAYIELDKIYTANQYLDRVDEHVAQVGENIKWLRRQVEWLAIFEPYALSTIKEFLVQVNCAGIELDSELRTVRGKVQDTLELRREELRHLKRGKSAPGVAENETGEEH